MSFKVRVLFTQWKQGELVSGFRKHAARYLVPFAFKELDLWLATGHSHSRRWISVSTQLQEASRSAFRRRHFELVRLG